MYDLIAGNRVRSYETADQGTVFLASDVATFFGISNMDQYLKSNVCQTDYLVYDLKDKIKGMKHRLVIKERGFYKIAIRCRKNIEAEMFENWVCGTVLPSIRKTGIYRKENF